MSKSDWLDVYKGGSKTFGQPCSRCHLWHSQSPRGLVRGKYLRALCKICYQVKAKMRRLKSEDIE